MGGDAGKTIQLTEVGKGHELTKGLPDEFDVFGDGPEEPPENVGNTWQGIGDQVANAAPGTQILAVWASNPEVAAIAVVEEGAELADGTPAPARRVMPFYGGGNVRPVNGSDHPMEWASVYQHITPEGRSLLRRCVQWALGETVTDVNDWSNQ